MVVHNNLHRVTPDIQNPPRDTPPNHEQRIHFIPSVLVRVAKYKFYIFGVDGPTCIPAGNKAR